MISAARRLTGRYGDRVWDGIIRGTGALALLGIPATIWSPEIAGGLIGFLLVTLWVNGPLGIFMPATYEPILMLFGRVYPPLLIAIAGMLAILYVEFLNYHLYARVLRRDRFRAALENRAAQKVLTLFRRAPFFAIWLCSWSPLPFWSVRILASVTRYPVRRYLLATFLGRCPRLWFFASLGIWWNVEGEVLAVISLAAIAVAVAMGFRKRQRQTGALVLPGGSNAAFDRAGGA